MTWLAGVKSKLIQKRKAEKTHVVSVGVLHTPQNVRFELSDDDTLLLRSYIVYSLEKYIFNTDRHVRNVCSEPFE